MFSDGDKLPHNPLPPPSDSRIKMTQDGASWLYHVIQAHVMEATLKSPRAAASFQPHADLIRRIKHAAGL